MTSRAPRVAAAIVTSSLAALLLWCGGARGVAYVGLLLLTFVPGLPLGWRLFGRAQPVGWVAGALIGYGLTALALWFPIAIGLARPIGFGAAWLLLTAAIWWRVPRDSTPLLVLPEIRTRDVAAWLLVLQLVVMYLALPFGRLGARDAIGTKYYRAYFTADFIWHAALTQELARFDTPPRNPFFAHDPVHYYYTYFLVPAVLSGGDTHPVVDVETALKLTAIGAALLMFSLVFFAAWAAVGSAGAATAASLLALIAPSFEGLYKLVDLWRRGAPLSAVTNLNIDAITAWDFHGLRIDGLVRSMWYTPQHATSFALGLVAMVVASRLPARARAELLILVGVVLGLSVVMNPLLGAAFCGIYGVSVLYDVVSRRSSPSQLAWQILAVGPVALALAWCLANRMGDGAAAHLSFGWLYDARNAPLLTLFLSLGGLLVPALVGLGRWRSTEFRPVVPAIAGAAVGLALLYLVTLTDRSWVGFRAGNVLQVSLPVLAARGFAGLQRAGRGRLAVAAVAGLLCLGAPTTLIDTYNAQDISNLRMGPGFPWTITLSPAQQAGFAWLRSQTDPRAIVQADPSARARANWSVIPTFAGRRMAAGQALPLLSEPQQGALVGRVHELITALPLSEAHDEARRLGIQFLWLDGDDAAIRPDPVARFLPRPDLFTPVFRQGEVAVYRVN